MPNMTSPFVSVGDIRLYRVDDAHDGVVDALTAVAIVAPDVDDAALHLYNDATEENVVESTGITYDDNGIPSINISSTIPDIVAFMETAAPRKAGTAAGVTRNEKSGENGLKIGGASGGNSNPKYLMVQIGSISGTKIELICAIVQVKPSSGTRSRKVGDTVMPTLDLVCLPCKKTGGFVVAQDCIDATHVGTVSAGLRTIGKDFYVKESWVDAA